jgi:hypothetical protein
MYSWLYRSYSEHKKYSIKNCKFQNVTTSRGADLFFLPFHHIMHGFSAVILWLLELKFITCMCMCH